jgi:hypothetical protein
LPQSAATHTGNNQFDWLTFIANQVSTTNFVEILLQEEVRVTYSLGQQVSQLIVQQRPGILRGDTEGLADAIAALALAAAGVLFSAERTLGRTAADGLKQALVDRIEIDRQSLSNASTGAPVVTRKTH